MSAAAWGKLRDEEISSADLAAMSHADLQKIGLEMLDGHHLWTAHPALRNIVTRNEDARKKR